MIIVKATMYPANGGPSYEILHASVTNVTGPEDVRTGAGDRYVAHVTQRPRALVAGELLDGFEADVEVRGHRFESGFAPLLAAILGQASRTVGYGHSSPLVLPEVVTRARLVLTDVHEFERAARRYA